MSKLELLDLPAEILTRIVKCARDRPRNFYAPHLCPDPDPHGRADPWRPYPQDPYTMKRDLFDIIATCRTLRAIAEPLLYHRLQAFNAAPLLRTLLERPDLARRIRCLDITGYSECTIEKLDPAAVDVAAEDLGITLPPEWWLVTSETEDLPENTPRDTVYGMILALVAENLEALFVDAPFEGFPANLVAESSDIMFESLRNVWISHYDTEGGFRLDSAEHLFIRAPKLEHLWINMCCQVDSFLDFGNVRSLRMLNSTLDEAALALLVRACPLLEDFSYTGAGLPEGDEHFSPAQMLRIMKTRKRQLRHLDFDPDCNGEYMFTLDNSDLDDEEMWFDTMVDLEVLETLVVPPAYFLAGQDTDFAPFATSREFFELLPPSLKSLEIVAPAGAPIHVSDATELVKTVQVRFPSLKRFVLDVPTYQKKEVSDAFAAVGIQLRKRFWN